MPVNEITSTTLPLPTPLQGPSRAAAQANVAATSAGGTAQATAGLTPAQQAALLINQTLADLHFTLPPSELDSLTNPETNPEGAAIDLLEGLTPAQQAALATTDSLLNLSPLPSPPANPLLINETSPILEANSVLATTEAAEDANLVQTSEVETNETLTGLGVAQTVLTLAEKEALLQNPLIPGVTATVAVPVTPPVAAATVAATDQNLLLATNTAAVAATPAATTLTPAEIAAATQTPALIAAATTGPRDPTPFAFAVYEIKDQNPAAPEPTPIKREIFPPLPPGRVRPVDRLVLKREWQRHRGNERQQGSQEEETPTTEKSLRQMVAQANEDLLANGLPLHLVLTKTAEGYFLDVYDCSDGDSCHVEQEIPLDLTKLNTILDNIQHETGMIIDIMT